MSNTKYIIPTNWNQLPFSRFCKSIGKTDLAYFAEIANIPLDVLRNQIPLREASAIMDTLAFARELPTSQPINEFEFEGNKYHLTLDNLTLGQASDIDTLTNIHKNYDGIPYLIAVLFKLESEKTYNEYIIKVMQRAEKFKELPTDICLGIYNFFLLINQTQSNNFRELLRETKGMAIRQLSEANHYLRLIDGKQLCMDYQTETSLRLIQSRHSVIWNV